MICKTCGYETADNSTYCIYCGSAVAAYDPPQYQPSVDNDTINENYDNAKYFIEIADAILSPAIKALIFSTMFLIIGAIYGVAKCSFVKKWVKALPYVDESLLDPVTYEEYKAARGKVTAAKKISKIASGFSIFIFVLFGLLALELIIMLLILLLNA